MAASVVNDYQAEQLTYPRKEDGLPLRARSAGRAAWRTEDELDDEAVLGASPFDTSSDEWIETGTAYGLDSPKLQRLRRARDDDATFADWFNQRSVDLDDPSLDPNQRAATLRKVTSVSLLRAEFRTPDASREVGAPSACRAQPRDAHRASAVRRSKLPVRDGRGKSRAGSSTSSAR